MRHLRVRVAVDNFGLLSWKSPKDLEIVVAAPQSGFHLRHDALTFNTQVDAWLITCSLQTTLSRGQDWEDCPITFLHSLVCPSRGSDRHLKHASVHIWCNYVDQRLTRAASGAVPDCISGCLSTPLTAGTDAEPLTFRNGSHESEHCHFGYVELRRSVMIGLVAGRGMIGAPALRLINTPQFAHASLYMIVLPSQESSASTLS